MYRWSTILKLGVNMRITESQLRKIVREEILRESIYDSWHGGTYSTTGTPDPQRVWDKWVELGGLRGRRVFSYDLARELNLDDPSEIDYTGSGLMMRNGVVEEMISPMGESTSIAEAVQTREYKGKVYRATPQAISILKKFNFDVTAAVKSGAFDWIKSRGGSPWAVAQAAYIVATGGAIRRNPSTDQTSVLEAKVQKRKYGGKEYKSSSGSVAAIRKHGGSARKAVKAGAFDWADNPMAAAQAAHIVAMGEPTVTKGTKRKKG